MSAFNKASPVPAGAGPGYMIAQPHGGVPDFGEDAANFPAMTIDLATAREEEEVGITGTVLWAQEASDTSANVGVKFNTQSVEAKNFRLGMAMMGVRFSKLYLTNTAQPGKTITFVYGVEKAGGLRIENASLSGAVAAVASTLTPGADVTLAAAVATQILAANNNRREAIVSNLSSNTQTFRIGDATAAAALGAPLAPGASIILATTAEIWGYNPGAGAENVAVLEVVS